MLPEEHSDSWFNGLLLKAIPAILLIASIISFGKDYYNVLRIIWGNIAYYIGATVEPVTAEMSASVGIVVFNLVLGAGAFFIVWLLLVSAQGLLPVRDFYDTFFTAWRLIIFILGYHGPAFIIKDGKLRATPRELQLPFPGVAVIDFNSAMVLEKVIIPFGCINFLTIKLAEMLAWFFSLFGHRAPRVRVCGPGLTFIGYDERIQGVGELDMNSESVDNISGVVDLRLQNRNSRQQTDSGISSGVRGYTRDGIELQTNINTLFTIGQDPSMAPNVLQVAYQGAAVAQNLRVVTVAQDEKTGIVTIKSFSDELESRDKEEIHQSLQENRTLENYSEIKKVSREPSFDPNRVFSAVFARARQKSNHEVVLPWTDLPVYVAIDIFREILSAYNFDELYQIDLSQKMTIEKMKREMSVRMRNEGLLSYRVIAHSKRLPLIENRPYDPKELRTGPVTPLKTPKILRDRGIQMVMATFGELAPDSVVFKQWLASWRATWERDTETNNAISELEVTRILNRARAQAQDDLNSSFREIFQTGHNSREVIAIRILQALESIAADPKTRQLLPDETMGMLRMIHEWLLPEDPRFWEIIGPKNVLPPDSPKLDAK